MGCVPKVSYDGYLENPAAGSIGPCCPSVVLLPCPLSAVRLFFFFPAGSSGLSCSGRHSNSSTLKKYTPALSKSVAIPLV